MTDNPRPRPSRGVMGYVAELQQFDPVPPYADEPAPAGPVPPAAPAPSPPRAVRAPIVSHIRQQSQRRIRAIIAGVLVILAGSGLGYATLSGPAASPRAQAPATGPAGRPTDGLLPPDPALPGVEPVAERPTDPAATSTTTATAGTTRASRTAGPLPDAVTLPGPGNPPPAAGAPTEPAGPATTQPAVVPPLPLTATISYVTDPAEDGLPGYAGTVHIENPGTRDVTGWRVTLTVPGGNTVTASGASVAQDGETVTFTPSGEAVVPAGGAVTFSFQVAGLPAALPGGCVIDGSPCS